MTRYEELTRKIEVLKAAGLRCATRGSARVAAIWYGKAAELERIRARQFQP